MIYFNLQQIFFLNYQIPMHRIYLQNTFYLTVKGFNKKKSAHFKTIKLELETGPSSLNKYKIIINILIGSLNGYQLSNLNVFCQRKDRYKLNIFLNLVGTYTFSI